MKATPKIGSRGISLFEAVIVVGLIAAITAIAIPAMYREYQASRVQTAARIMATNLRYARMAAVKQKIEYQVIVKDDSEASNPNTYVVEYDPTRLGSFVTYPKLDTDIPDGVIIDPSSLDSVKFNSRGGALPIPSGSILLIGPDNTKYNVTVTLSGAVSMNRI